jgi:hypothetical protein
MVGEQRTISPNDQSRTIRGVETELDRPQPSERDNMAGEPSDASLRRKRGAYKLTPDALREAHERHAGRLMREFDGEVLR